MIKRKKDVEIEKGNFVKKSKNVNKNEKFEMKTANEVGI
jgi:hypothetical protein